MDDEQLAELNKDPIVIRLALAITLDKAQRVFDLLDMNSEARLLREHIAWLREQPL